MTGLIELYIYMLNLTAYNGVPVVDVKCADTSLCHIVNCFVAP